jgi:hypothetical protein
MSGRPPQIVAFGGGGFSTEWGNTLLDDYVLSLTGVDRPRVCFLVREQQLPVSYLGAVTGGKALAA